MPRFLLLAVIFSLATTALGQSPLGFRTDGTGRYPNANPPLHWGPDKNVVWNIKLTQSNAIPVILGDKIITCAEPCVLLCVNKSNGDILWRKESSFSEIVLTEKEKSDFEIERQQGVVLGKQQSELERESSNLRKLLKEGSAPKEETEKKLDALKFQIDKIRAQRKDLSTLNRYLEPGKGAGGFHPTGGYSSPTPVTDGKHIYVLFGNGLAACYDLDGNRQWLKLIEHPTVEYGHGASPLLVKDKLLVHFSDLVALDVKDGSEAWRAKISPSHGSAMHANLGGVDVAIHPQGQVIRVSDGAILAKSLGSTGPNSPLVQDGKVFFVAGQVRGYELPTSMDIPAKWEPLWKGANLKGGGYWFPSPILHEGLLYALNATSIFSVVDAKTGQLIYDQRLEFDGGQSYPSITLAGNRLYVSSDNGATLVLKPGREYEELARNKLESFRSSLVFEGKRMYMRTTKGLWCIGEQPAMIVFDAHLDLAWNALDWNRNLQLSCAKIRQFEKDAGETEKGRGANTVSFPDLRRGKVATFVATVLARLFRPGSIPPIQLYAQAEAAFGAAMGQLHYYRGMEQRGHLRFLKDGPSLAAHIAAWKADEDSATLPLGFILSMEGADAILRPDQVREWWDAGLRIIGPCLYGVSPYGHGTGSEGGFFPEGRQLLREMEQVGMILDITHLSDQCFDEALDLFGGRLLASHHNNRTLVPHQRQLTDEQAKKIIARGGVIGHAFDIWMIVPNYVRGETQASVPLERLCDHIDRVCQLAGNACHAAIGSDLDGGFGREQSPCDLDTIADLQRIPEILARRGYKEADIEGILHANWVRFFTEAWT